MHALNHAKSCGRKRRPATTIGIGQNLTGIGQRHSVSVKCQRIASRKPAATKIDSIEAIIVDIPTICGHVLSLMTMMAQSVVLVRARFADGSVGTGDGTSIGGLSYGPESVEGIKLVIDTYITPALIGVDGDAVNACTARMEKSVKGNPSARATVETALWDGLARRMGVSIAQLFWPARA
jgi:muconate cycloisomerase